MNGKQFAALQMQTGANDDQLALALGTKTYVIRAFKDNVIKIGGPSQLCIRMLADMPAEQRKQYLGSGG